MRVTRLKMHKDKVQHVYLLLARAYNFLIAHESTSFKHTLRDYPQSARAFGVVYTKSSLHDLASVMEVESTHAPANQSKHQLTTAKRQSHDFHMPRLRLRLLAAQNRLAAAGDPVHPPKGLIVVTTAFLLAGGASNNVCASCPPYFKPQHTHS
jgi:hypothetical protein